MYGIIIGRNKSVPFAAVHIIILYPILSYTCIYIFEKTFTGGHLKKKKKHSPHVFVLLSIVDRRDGVHWFARSIVIGFLEVFTELRRRTYTHIIIYNKVLMVIAFIRIVVVCRGRSTAAAERSICILYNIILYLESGIPHAVTRGL